MLHCFLNFFLIILIPNIILFSPSAFKMDRGNCSKVLKALNLSVPVIDGNDAERKSPGWATEEISPTVIKTARKKYTISFSSDESIQILWNIDPTEILISKDLTWKWVAVSIKIGKMNKSVKAQPDRYFIKFDVWQFREMVNTDSNIICQPVQMQHPCQQKILKIGTANSLRLSSEPDLSVCPLHLSYFVNETSNLMHYRWEASHNDTNLITEEYGIKTYQPTYYKNIHRHLKYNPNCLIQKELQLDHNCSGDCVRTVDTTEGGVILLAKTTSYQMMYKGVFALDPDSPTFYWDWAVPLEAMIVVLAPEMVFIEHKFKVFCHISTLFFGYGSVITVDGEPIPRFEQKVRGVNPQDEHEQFTSDGIRSLWREFEFTRNSSNTREISCIVPLLNYSRTVVKSIEISVQAPVQPYSEDVVASTEVVIFETGEINGSISCNFSGNPEPSIEWKLLNGADIENFTMTTITKNGSTSSILQFPTFVPKLVGAYQCVASNFAGSMSRTFIVELPSTVGRISMGTIIGGCVVIILISIPISYVILKAFSTSPYDIETKRIIQEFRNGSQLDGDANNNHILTQPFIDKYEIRRELWTLDDSILGAGAFGVVRRGSVKVDDERMEIAIKSMSCSEEDANNSNFRNFLIELKIMAFIGHHPNIVGLVASCIRNIDHSEVMIGIELCSGNLKTRLTEMNQDTDSFAKSTLITTLLTWSMQIAEGMQFLGEKNVLHGDLATRNVLLSGKSSIAKISDFGLSRMLEATSNYNYSKKSNTPVPWRWLSLESHTAKIFSTQSDVWSYGVTLWEMFTLRESDPYSNFTGSVQEFVEELKNGLRLDKPAIVPDTVWEVMHKCWEADPIARPSFTSLVRRMKQEIGI